MLSAAWPWVRKRADSAGSSLVTGWRSTPALEQRTIVRPRLVTNAIVHSAERDPSSTICLRADVEGDNVVLEVEDPGGGFTWPVSHEMRDVLDSDEHGRGQFIVEALTDRLGVVRSGDAGTIVRCVKFGVLHHTPTSREPGLSARFRAQEQRTH